MKLGAQGEALIKSFETLVLTGYLDVGVPAAGWGHRGPGIIVGQTYTVEQAQAWFDSDTASAVAAVSRCVDVALTQNQFDALVSFTYNLGSGALAHSTLLALVNRNEMLRAADEFLRWDHVGGVESAGVERRRKAERALFMQPVLA